MGFNKCKDHGKDFEITIAEHDCRTGLHHFHQSSSMLPLEFAPVENYVMIKLIYDAEKKCYN